MLCLFDLDGTLIDSEVGILGCVRHALTQLGVEHPTEMRHWIGPPLRHSFAPLLDHDHDRIELAVDYYHERFHAIGWQEHTVYPGIETMIGRLQAAGHTLAVVTSKPERHARPIIEHLPFGAQFSRLYGPDPSSPHSEKASMIAAALVDFDAEPEHTVMIGDRHFDIDGAVANGVRGIGVLWGFGSRQELEKAGAHALAGSPQDLATLLSA